MRRLFRTMWCRCNEWANKLYIKYDFSSGAQYDRIQKLHLIGASEVSCKHYAVESLIWTIVTAPHRPKKSSSKTIILSFIKIAQRHNMTSCWNQYFQNQCSISFPTIYKMPNSVNVTRMRLANSTYSSYNVAFPHVTFIFFQDNPDC